MGELCNNTSVQACCRCTVEGTRERSTLAVRVARTVPNSRGLHLPFHFPFLSFPPVAPFLLLLPLLLFLHPRHTLSPWCRRLQVFPTIHGLSTRGYYTLFFQKSSVSASGLLPCRRACHSLTTTAINTQLSINLIRRTTDRPKSNFDTLFANSIFSA